jgi:hypothetical protein
LQIRRNKGSKGNKINKIRRQKADIDRPHVKIEGKAKSLLQIEAAHSTRLINAAEYVNKKYKEDQFVKIVTSHDGNQTNTN